MSSRQSLSQRHGSLRSDWQTSPEISLRRHLTHRCCRRPRQSESFVTETLHGSPECPGDQSPRNFLTVTHSKEDFSQCQPPTDGHQLSAVAPGEIGVATSGSGLEVAPWMDKIDVLQDG